VPTVKVISRESSSLVVYRDGSSRISGGSTGGPDRNRKSRKWSRAHAQPVPALFSYYSSTQCSTVVQGPWLPEVIEGHVTPKGVPWKGVRMRNRKLHNINPSRAFSPEVTEGHLTQKGFPWNWKLGVFSRTSASYSLIIFTGYLLRCSLGRPRPITLSFSLVICPLYFHNYIIYFNNYTTKVCCFRICCVVLHVRVLTVVFILY